uniref:Uncharacterized protein n=1 Tax=Timema poppense TaxID=170557 RepID=A0A7R9DGM6_TIMPO|nr:unnamed protein product [Timema poppensis]
MTYQNFAKRDNPSARFRNHTSDSISDIQSVVVLHRVLDHLHYCGVQVVVTHLHVSNRPTWNRELSEWPLRAMYQSMTLIVLEDYVPVYDPYCP